MITIKEIADVTMTPEKRKLAKNDYFAFYIGRPLSYLLTIPFLYTSITPNVVSLVSIIPLLIGFGLMWFGTCNETFLLAWLCFFLWNLLDGVDGNIARYKKVFSKYGSVFDALSGYVAMVLTFFAVGIASAHSEGFIKSYIPLTDDSYIVLGALSGVFVIFPRFIMHKTISTVGKSESTDNVKDKSKFGFYKIVALNLISISGFVQVLMLLSIVFNALDLFTIVYFFINFLVMIVSLRSIFK